MTDPTTPRSNAEKFKPQNVKNDPKGDVQRPADTGGNNIARGSETETRNSSNHRG
ncbi:hypothetical protein [Qipengyuania marisflavi]|uniref:hypothetical protein n=1 Tax=Qipengyuania marisflavi TaxID=2486356 RepID=UPI0014870401|nr:hypothetical protein [Qipengyuania marisflavi]